MMKLIDIHAHLDFKDYDADRAEVIRRTREADCGVINVGVDLSSSRAVVRLAEENDLMWATVGAHPQDAKMMSEEEWRELETLAAHERVVAVGECGLDYSRLRDENEKEKQLTIFERQIELALRLGKPMMLHIRDGASEPSGQAYVEVIASLKKFPAIEGNAHFFAGDLLMAKKFVDLGFTVSFTGVITFSNQYDEVIREIPLEQIMVETDSPFVAPALYRGRRNEPLYVVEVVKRIAEIKGQSVTQVTEAVVANARRLFRL